MQLSPSSSHQLDVHQALTTLQRASTKITGPLQSPEEEMAILRAIRREPIAHIGTYQVYMDTSRDERTTVFVHSPIEGDGHKYIIARATAHTYVIAMPVKWTVYHKNILARVMAATSQTVFCPGGGFVLVDSEGRLAVEGESTDFGAGDHALAKAALASAVKHSKST